MGRVFPNGPGNRGSISKTQKIVLALLNSLNYKVRINSKVEQSKEWSSTLPTPPRSSY